MDDESNSLMKIGSYKIKQILGQGSFGKVYKSYSKKKDRKIALKVDCNIKSRFWTKASSQRPRLTS